MSLNDVTSFVDFIANNKSIHWIIVSLLIIIFSLIGIGMWILGKYKKSKKTIIENLDEFRIDFKNFKMKYKVFLGIIMVLLCIMVFAFVRKVKIEGSYLTIALLDENDEVIYPIGVDILKEEVVDEYTFFTYEMSEIIGDDIITYPVLYKWKKGELAERLSEYACPHFEIVKSSIVYLNSTLTDLSHGQIFVARPDGLNKRIQEKEVYDFTIDGEYIYFSYCFDTIGVGLDGHALYRMDLNGNNKVKVAYELSSPILRGNHFDVVVEDGWAVYDNYMIELGYPANGLEKVVLLDNINDEWIYYTSNRLIKATPDGLEQEILDDDNDFWYEIDNIDDNWIYYRKGNDLYKIDTDGNNKSKIEK